MNEKNNNIINLICPSINKLFPELLASVRNRKTVVLIAKCNIKYNGRAISKIDWGERIILIKEDKTILVHRKFGSEPINWQPAEGYIEIEKNKSIYIHAFKIKPKENLLIEIKDVILFTSIKLLDEAIFEMGLTEKDIYKAIKFSPEIIEPEFRIKSMQKRIKTGITDFIGVDKSGRDVIVEIKKNSVKTDDVKQLHKYFKIFSNKNWRGVILAPNISSKAMELLTQYNLEYIKLDINNCIKVLNYNSSRYIEKLDKHLEPE